MGRPAESFSGAVKDWVPVVPPHHGAVPGRSVTVLTGWHALLVEPVRDGRTVERGLQAAKAFLNEGSCGIVFQPLIDRLGSRGLDVHPPPACARFAAQVAYSRFHTSSNLPDRSKNNPIREGGRIGGSRSRIGQAERKERICCELLHLRDRKLKEPDPCHVVKKCPSPVATT